MHYFYPFVFENFQKQLDIISKKSLDYLESLLSLGIVNKCLHVGIDFLCLFITTNFLLSLGLVDLGSEVLEHRCPIPHDPLHPIVIDPVDYGLTALLHKDAFDTE